MKSVLALVLLIGISCQIGRGDCGPADTLYGEMKEIASDTVQYVKDTYNQYMPSMPDVIPDVDMPSVPVPDSLKNGYETVKDGMGDMAEGVGDMAKDTMDSLAKDID